MPLLGKWVPFILLLLAEKPRHFADLERQMTGVSRKVLTENLTNLVSYGIVHKEGESSTGFPVYYHLTELGQSSLFILDSIKNWLREHEEELLHNREKSDKKA
ncbi:PadR family transcriptional regulator [Enterococcus sp. JM4C]|nr:PadR family transcriptional regulator [Enterococcus sp. JM4C]